MWLTTKDGRHFNTDWAEDADKPIVSKYSGDEITQKMALNSWAKNATNIKKASQGVKYNPDVIRNEIGFNDEAKAELIKKFVTGHSVNHEIYRGIQNLSDADYKRYTTVGNAVNEKGLSSWSTNKSTASGYGRLGKGIMFIKTSETKNARKLGNLVGTDIEGEVIVLDAESKIYRVEKSNYTTFVYVR